MSIERTIGKFYYLTGDEKSKVGNADPVGELSWDFFVDKNSDFVLTDPFTFKIGEGRFSGIVGDYQFNSCGFYLFSDKLRQTIEKHLTDIDEPKWFPARVIDMENNDHNYSILHFFNKPDFLDEVNSTFVPGTNHPIRLRYDLNKIGDRLIFRPIKVGTDLCIHDIVRKEIRNSRLTGTYFYKIHTAGRLS